MKPTFLIEEELSVSPFWLKVYASVRQDWAEKELECLILNYPKSRFRLIKREVMVDYNPR
jgi:hypothetical protein